MKIIEVTKNNLQDIKDDALQIISEQMECIGGSTDQQRINQALENALKTESRARLFLAYKRNELVGMCFLNVCSGLESGGDYIYINEINIRKASRGLGYGTILLNYVKSWGAKNGYRYIAAVTSDNNEASQGLFSKNGFSKSEVAWLDLNI